MAGITDTTIIPQAVNYFYDRVLLRKAVPLFVHLKWAQVRDIPKNQGTSIKFRRYSLLTPATTPLTEGVTPPGSQLAYAEVTAEIEQYGDYITFSDKFLFTTFDPVLTENAELLSIQYQQTIEQVCRDIMVLGSNVQWASTATSTGTITAAMKITKLEVMEAVRTLKTNIARKITSQIDFSTGFNSSPIATAYIGICSASTTFDLKNIPGFIRVEEYGQKKAIEGEVGALDEVRFIETTEAKVGTGLGSGSIDVHYTLILGADAYGITRISTEAIKNIIKPLGSAGTADPLDQRQTHGWKATFVAKILNQAWMLRLEHAVS